MINENKGNTRLTLTDTDTAMDIIIKMSDGNPGCMTFLMDLMVNSKWGGALGGLGQILLLDSLGIYAGRAYKLWNDCCNRDLELTERVLRNFQMGHLSKETIIENLDQIRGIPFQNLKSFEELGLTKINIK